MPKETYSKKINENLKTHKTVFVVTFIFLIMKSEFLALSS